MNKNVYTLIFVVFSLAFSQEVQISYPENSESGVTIQYQSTEDIYGFQFRVTGGELQNVSSTFDLISYNASSGMVFGTSLSGESLPAGYGELVQLEFIPILDGYIISLEDVIIGGQVGATLSVSPLDDILIPPCANTDGDQFCNVFDSFPDCNDDGLLDPYDECGVCGGDSSSCTDCAGVPNGDEVLDNCGVCDNDSTNDCTQDCSGEWGGSLELDECGICGGSGILEGECDCNGNTLDDCGECGGSNYGDFDADGNCDAEDLSPYGEVNLSFGNITEGGADIIYTSDVDIFGFQLNVSGIQLNSVISDFDLLTFNASNGIILGSSLSGLYLPSGSGILVTLVFLPVIDGGDLTFFNIIAGGAGGTNILVTDSDSAIIPPCADDDEDSLCNVYDDWPYCSDDGETNPYDDCGVCNGANYDKDCNGDCFGSAEIDDCGLCSGGNSGHLENSDMDCNGDCFGTAFIDSCGICSEGSSNHTANSDIDCNNDCFGSAFIDSCGVCSEGNSGHEQDSDIDCNGECFGLAGLDECGVCSGGNSGHIANSDVDCNGDCFGAAFIDSCGVCSEGNSEHTADEDLDACGLCWGDGWSCVESGDINGDYAVNIMDVIIMVEYILWPELPIMTDLQISLADTYADGIINIIDVTIVIDMILYPENYGLSREDTLEMVVHLLKGNSHLYVAVPDDRLSYDITIKHVEPCEIYLTQNAIVSEMRSDKNNTRMIIISPYKNDLFSTTAEFEIVDLKIAGSGNLLNYYIENAPLEFSLSPAYPNPFNPQTTLEYALPAEMIVSIGIYDITGRLIQQLVNQEQSIGVHRVTWDASLHPSGMYFARFIGNGYYETQKLVVLK